MLFSLCHSYRSCVLCKSLWSIYFCFCFLTTNSWNLNVLMKILLFWFSKGDIHHHQKNPKKMVCASAIRVCLVKLSTATQLQLFEMSSSQRYRLRVNSFLENTLGLVRIWESRKKSTNNMMLCHTRKQFSMESWRGTKAQMMHILTCCRALGFYLC